MDGQDWKSIVADLDQLLKLRSVLFGMKLFERREEMEAIPKIRRPKAVHTLDQLVAQTARLGWTVGVTSDDLVGPQCRAVVGLGGAKDAEWRSGRHMTGVWYATQPDAAAHVFEVLEKHHQAAQACRGDEIDRRHVQQDMLGVVAAHLLHQFIDKLGELTQGQLAGPDGGDDHIVDLLDDGAVGEHHKTLR